MADAWDDESKQYSNVKDNWDDELEDVKDAWDEEEEVEAPKPSKKTTKQDDAKATSKNLDIRELTEEEKKEAQLRADMSNAQELFGLGKSLEEFSLETKEDCKDFVDRLYSRINLKSNNSQILEFLDELLKSLTKNLTADAVKKLSTTIRQINDAKIAEEKSKTKDTKKPKSKAKIKLEANPVKGDFDDFIKDSHKFGYDEDDNDDFM